MNPIKTSKTVQQWESWYISISFANNLLYVGFLVTISSYRVYIKLKQTLINLIFKT